MTFPPFVEYPETKMIFISGVHRSGTTILGKLIGSAQDVEYHFQPQTLRALSYILESAVEKGVLDLWTTVFKAYCHEELMLGALAGRNLNFNRNDDSCIYNTKDEAVIEERLSKSHEALELQDLAGNSHLAIKLPDIFRPFIELEKVYPGIKKVLVLRHPNEVINSCVDRKWYDYENDARPPAFPIIDGTKLPMWLEEDKYDWWMSTNEVDRIAHYILVHWEYIEKIQNKFLVNYTDLVANPIMAIEELFESLELRLTPKTEEVIRSVEVFEPKRYPDLFAKVDPDLRSKILEIIDSLKLTF